jgi:isopenicillin N synthase-like dioxygenase
MSDSAHRSAIREAMTKRRKQAMFGSRVIQVSGFYLLCSSSYELERHMPDFGTVTVLWSQPVAGLQILSPDGKWRWIRHIDNAVVWPSGFYIPCIL